MGGEKHAERGIGGVFVSSQPRKRASDDLERHVSRDGIAYVIPITKMSRNHPVMSDGEVDVEVELDVVLARARVKHAG